MSPRGWAVNPYKPTDHTIDFSKSKGESINFNKTVVQSGSIQLGTGGTGNVTSRDADNSSYDPSAGTREGLEFNPNTSLDGIIVTISSNTEATSSNTEALLIEESSSTQLDSKAGPFSSGEEHTLSASLSSGTDYVITMDWASGETDGYTDSPSYPYTGTDLDIIGGWNDGPTTDYADAFVSIEGTSTATSGDALIYWGLPSNITEWDLALFERTLDNETVTVDIEDSNGTVLHSDIHSGFDISDISSGTEIRIRANLSRADTNNNPTLDYAGLQYKR